MSRHRLLAKFLLIPVSAAALVVGFQGTALADPTGCHHMTGGDEISSWNWATCTTAAPGIYFRSWIHCKHRDAYGRVSYYKHYSRWDWQGTSTGKLWAWCNYGDVYSSYNSAPGGVETGS
jgi:hypothetical protein